MTTLLDQKNNRIRNLIIDLVYFITLLLLAYVCFRLFGWMLINYNRQYRSDIPAYISILDSRPGTRLRLVYVVFRFMLNLTDTEIALNIFLALVIVVICLCNHYYIRYFSGCDISRPSHRLATAFMSVAVIFAGPIYVPRIHPYFYKNTFPIFAWQSPTQHLLTLFSVLATVSLFKLMDTYKEKISIPWWLASAAFFFLSAYSKPSYILDIAPAVIIVFIIELLVKSDVPAGIRFRRLFIIGLSLVPAGLYIIMLYMHIYSGESESEVVVALTNASGSPHILVALICCMLFPAIVILFNIRKVFSDRRFLLIITLALMGLLQMGLLSESGWRSEHGNFTWGCVIGGYMLMLTCMTVFLENCIDRNYLADKKALKGLYYLMACGALTLHLVSNIYYFVTMYNGAGFWR
ncbi:MAG: hypothetical protein IJJ03_08295 [Mogibacterium sp.]|nr:hypothetical protein [Mogibacterium sp.]